MKTYHIAFILHCIRLVLMITQFGSMSMAKTNSDDIQNSKSINIGYSYIYDSYKYTSNCKN